MMNNVIFDTYVIISFRTGNIIMDMKAKRNIRIAEYAEGINYYDVAISRYYYSIYQRIIHILLVKYGKNEKDIYDDNAERSHQKTIDYFLQTARRDLGNPEIKVMSSLPDLRKARNKADYKPYNFTADRFKLEFKRHYLSIVNILDRMIQE